MATTSFGRISARSFYFSLVHNGFLIFALCLPGNATRIMVPRHQHPVISGIVSVTQISWESNAKNLRGRLRQDFTFICPSQGRVGTVWGTDLYTDDSSICSAAVHFGLITAKNGGRVTIRIQPGASFYNGTTRNGVISKRYNDWPGSFSFLDSTRSPIGPDEQVLLLEWNASAKDLRGRLEQDFVFDCPRNGKIGTIWGTYTYTDDSSICSAAVHAGLITSKDGGRVTIRIKPGYEAYMGTTLNGVKSNNYGFWHGSFTFIK
jgi:hypothetical protein